MREPVMANSRLMYWMMIAGMVLLLSSCVVRLAYNKLDRLMLWKVERLVKLDGEQKEDTRLALRAFHQWHRQTQLPQYIAYLEEFKALLAQGELDGKTIHQETDKIQTLLDLSLNRLLPDITRMLSTLSDSQVDELMASLAEEQQEYVDEYVKITSEKRLQQRASKMEGYLKRWTGSLNREQKQWLDQWADSLMPYETLTAAQQERWHNQIGELLRERDDTAALFAGLGELMFYRTDNWNDDIKAAYDHNQQLTYQVVARVLNNLTDHQLARFNKKLDGYIDDFTKLSGS